MDLADSAVYNEGDDDEPETNPNSLKPMLPAGTSIDEVEKRFVYKLRKSLFNVESAIEDVTAYMLDRAIKRCTAGLGETESQGYSPKKG